jgi:hypothetical protein
MDVSLLIQTCDNYKRYWPGMLFSLDFNWDFSKIPVYWASEEVNIHEIKFQSRGLEYKPNNQIRQILTGRTDKNGFSTRMRIALEKIPSKWVIYLQEDMWLLSAPSADVLSELLLFAEINQANSIKIHTKLHYYESYILEPTQFMIRGNRILKYSQTENYLHSHNATIWNREYLLDNLKDGEDPWTNEIEGSKRMSSKPHNHFHYNLHWYSQPGVCEMGEDSRDFFTLAPILDDRMHLKLLFERK